MMRVTRSEEILAHLHGLYQGYGYIPYKVSKFEEYDLYAHNRSFLLSEKILTFTDTDGKLMALKPDVTLSIVKTVKKGEQGTKKVSYTESVYRPKGSGEGFGEIRQTGIECIGRVDGYLSCEVIALAAESLKLLSETYVLDLSHMGFLEGLLAYAGLDDAEIECLFSEIGQKNLPFVRRFLTEKGVNGEMLEAITAVTRLSAPLGEALDILRPYCFTPVLQAAYDELAVLYGGLKAWGVGGIRLDFSVQNDRSYYNGLVFQGYIRGVPEAVLSGGRYDKLLLRMGKEASAIGFALCPEKLPMEKGDGYDADVLLTYSVDAAPGDVAEAVAALRREGLTVRAEAEGNDISELHCRRICGLGDVKVGC